MEHFKYPINIPENKKQDVIISLLIGNLASINALIAQLAILSRAEIAKNPDKFPQISCFICYIFNRGSIRVSSYIVKYYFKIVVL
jgi:hypothetical protein